MEGVDDMRQDIKRLLKTLYDDLRSNVKLIDEYDEKYRFAMSIDDVTTAKFYNLRSLSLVEDNRRLITTISEIEKRVS